MMSREDLRRQWAESAAVQARCYRWLALFAVGGGVAQLLAIRWLDAHLAKQGAAAIELAVFLVY